MKADSVPDNVNGFHRHLTPEGNKGRMEEIIRNEFGHTVSSLLSVFRSVELVKASVNSWNFQALKLPDVFKLSLKDAYFTTCTFSEKRRKTGVGACSRDNWNLEITPFIMDAMSQALHAILTFHMFYTLTFPTIQ